MTRRHLMTTLSGLLLTLAVTLTAVAQPHDAHWVTAWTMSPSTLLPSPDVEDAFDNQTLRQIVRVTAAGESIRLRVSNAHGNKPLAIGAMTVAQHAGDGALLPGTLQEVTFSGESHFNVARGAVAISDPVALNVSDLDELAVSIYLPQGSGNATTHRVGLQTNYLIAGDATTELQLPDGAETFEVWHFLRAVDVLADEAVSTIVTVGDSITDGVGSTLNANLRWPDQFLTRLRADSDMPQYAIANAGISGNRVLHERAEIFGENLQARFERDVLALSGVSHIVLLEGINDIGMSVSLATDQEVTPEQIIAGYRQIIARAKARDITIIGATLTPFAGAGYYTEEGEAKRQQVNAWIRSSGAFDAVIDFDRAMGDPQNPGRLPASFTSDNLHPNDAGYKAMADSIDLGIFR